MPFENDYLAQQARRPFHFKSRRADIQLFLSKEFNSILVWSQMMARHVVLTKHKLGPKVTQFLNVTVNSATVRNRPSGPIFGPSEVLPPEIDGNVLDRPSRWKNTGNAMFLSDRFLSENSSDIHPFIALQWIFKLYFPIGKACRERSRRSLPSNV